MRLRMVLAFAAVMACGSYMPVCAEQLKLPPDVKAFVEQRYQCDHWLGETPYDEETAREANDALEKYCTGTNAQLAELREKYRDRPDVIEFLSKYKDKTGW